MNKYPIYQDYSTTLPRIYSVQISLPQAIQKEKVQNQKSKDHITHYSHTFMLPGG